MAESREIRQQELARLLLQKAQQDWALVREIRDIKGVADEIVGFHVQQAIEKAIKAVLVRLGVQYEYIHDLSLLYQQVENAGVDLPTTLDAVEGLTAFAVQFRYMLYEEPGFDREAGSRLAREFIQWAHAVIETPVRPENVSARDEA